MADKALDSQNPFNQTPDGLPGRSSERLCYLSTIARLRFRYGAAVFALRRVFRAKTGGAEGVRTPDPHNAIVVLYQLSYDPTQSANTLNGCRRLSKKNATQPLCLMWRKW